MKNLYIAGLLVSLLGAATPSWAERDCTRLTEAEGRPLCELAKQGKPFAYTVRTRKPGKGSTLCEKFAANLRAIQEPPNCQLKINPKFAKDFQLPQWEELDPWNNLDLLWRAAVAAAPGMKGKREVDTMTRDAWLEHYKTFLYKNDYTPVLRKAFVDLNGDDDPEWVLAYGFSAQCNSWGYPPGPNDVIRYFILRKGDQNQMDEVAMSGSGPVPFQWGTLLRSRYLDGDGNNTHSYILGDAWGLGYSNKDGPNRPHVSGFVYELYAVQYMGQPVGMHVCTFELRKTFEPSK